MFQIMSSQLQQFPQLTQSVTDAEGLPRAPHSPNWGQQLRSYNGKKIADLKPPLINYNKKDNYSHKNRLHFYTD